MDECGAVYHWLDLPASITVTVRRTAGFRAEAKIYSRRQRTAAIRASSLQQPVGRADGWNEHGEVLARPRPRKHRPNFVVGQSRQRDLELGSADAEWHERWRLLIIQPEQTLVKAGKSTTFAILVRPTAAGTHSGAACRRQNLRTRSHHFDVNLTGTATVIDALPPTDVMKSFDRDTRPVVTPRGASCFRAGRPGNASGGAQSKACSLVNRSGLDWPRLDGLGISRPPAFPSRSQWGTLVGSAAAAALALAHYLVGGTATPGVGRSPADHAARWCRAQATDTRSFGGTGLWHHFQSSAGGVLPCW